jgi:SAM-dependent methyltransferase
MPNNKDIFKMKEIYEQIYASGNSAYNEQYDYKLEIVKKELFYLKTDIRILDVGCGKGNYLKFLHENKFTNTLGLELSEECSKNFLYNFKHINADFLEYKEKFQDKEFDLLICMDLLEHLSYENIPLTLQAFERISDYCILGIANHPDIFEGIDLHLIQENIDWWENYVKKYFTTVEIIYQIESPNGIIPGINNHFFMFRCKN